MMTHCSRQLKAGLILHTGAIGDCLLTLPLAAFVRETFGLDRMDFIGNTEYIGFYPGRTCIDNIRSSESIPLYQLFSEDIDSVLEDTDRLQTVFSEYEHIVSFLGADHPYFEQNLLFAVHCTHAADVTVIPSAAPTDYPAHLTKFYKDFYQRQNQPENRVKLPGPYITPLPTDYLAGADILQQVGVNPDSSVIVVHPGSGSPDKCWHWENFVTIASSLQQKGLQPVFLLGPAEQERFDQIALQAIHQFLVLENMSLTEILQVLTQTDIFLGNDSGISHLSALMGKQTVVLFGASNDTHYRPLGQNACVLKPSTESFSNPDQIEQQHIIKAILDKL